MPIIKKIVFVPVFLILLATVIYFYQPILNQYLEIFFSKYGGLYEFGILAIILTLASLSYCLYITLTQNIKFASPVVIAALFIPFIFLKPQLALIIGIGLFLSLTITYFTLQIALKNYVNFQPGKLLTSPIKTLNTLIVLTLAFGYFLNANSIIQTQGFKIPDTLVDWAIDLSLNQASVPVKGEKYLAQLPTLTHLPQANLKDIMKAQISDSLDQLIKPYLFAIPLILAFLFYSLVSFCLWIIGMFINPLILLIFYIFEKTNFIKFDKEMREVKKIVI